MSNFEFKGIRNKTLKDTIYTTLKNIILNHNFPSNEYITEQKLAEKLDVSRTPLREAMQDLVNEDLIEFKPRKGYKAKRHSLKEVNQIFLLRSVIEKEIIEPLFKNITTEDIDYLKTVVKRQKDMMESKDGYEFMQLDKQFHRKMFMIADYNIFLKSYDLFHNLTILIGSHAITEQGRMKEVIKEHLKIVEMIESKDVAGMEEAISDHLERTRNVYTEIQDTNINQV